LTVCCLRRRPAHAADDEPHGSRVGEEVAEAHGLVDRRRDRDGVGQEHQLVLVRCEVMLRVGSAPQVGQGVRLARRDERVMGHRHPLVHGDHDEVEPQPDQDQRETRQPAVDPCGNEQEQERRDQEQRASRPGDRGELQGDARQSAHRPPEAHVREVPETPSGQISDQDGDRDRKHDQPHGSPFMTRATRSIHDPW